MFHNVPRLAPPLIPRLGLTKSSLCEMASPIFPSTDLLPDFEGHGGRLETFDDGHRPETHRPFLPSHEVEGGRVNPPPPQIVIYDRKRASSSSSSSESSSSESSSSSSSSSHSSHSPNVHVYDGVLRPWIARMLYDVTSADVVGRQMTKAAAAGGAPSTSSGGGKEGGVEVEEEECCAEGRNGMWVVDGRPWGTYVTMEEARDWMSIEWRRAGADVTRDDEHVFECEAEWKRNLFRHLRRRRRIRDADGGVMGSSSSDEKKDDVEVRSEHRKERGEDDDDLRSPIDIDDLRHALAVEAVASFLLDIVPHRPGMTDAMGGGDTLYGTSDVRKRAHGASVWALSSKVGDSVSYHVDYAELLRYEHDVTVPPLWAGTIHCSDLRDGNTGSNDDDGSTGGRTAIIRGGEFCVNLRGLEHYAEHGYKGNLSGDPHGGWKRPTHNDGAGCGDGGERDGRCIGGGVHMSDVDRWVTVPYVFNRGIVHGGDLPHLSASVESISATNERGGGCDDSPPQISRVIIGLNVFGHDVGPIVATAPEHSKSFRRRVRLYRTAINACRPRVVNDDVVDDEISCRNGAAGMDLSRIRRSRGLTKLLVLAKRERVKEELRLAQERLSAGIRRRLLCNRASDLPPLRVADMIQEFGGPNEDSEDGMWPRSVDVHVHIHHMLLSAMNKEDDLSFPDEDGLAGPSGASYRIVQAALESGHTQDSHPTNDDESPRHSLISPSTCLDVLKCT